MSESHAAAVFFRQVGAPPCGSAAAAPRGGATLILGETASFLSVLTLSIFLLDDQLTS